MTTYAHGYWGYWETYDDLHYSLIPTTGQLTGLTYELNRLAATLDENGNPTLSAQGAANVWASITGPWELIPDPEEAATETGTGVLLSLVGALNVKNSTTDLGLRAVCNALGNTTDQDPAEALSNIETPT